ncbi:MAG: hypothetical protein JKY18_00860 [Flavobacteriales bacterium]|nr:hypothetical protein [Flavobacteriales bacterium]
MDDQLDIFFKQARESISEPVPISDIRNKISSAPAPQARKWWLRKRFQVIFVLALVFLAFYFFEGYRLTDQTETTPKETTQQEEMPDQEKNVPLEEPSANDETTGIVDSESQEEVTEGDLPIQKDKTPDGVQSAETGQAQEGDITVPNPAGEADPATETALTDSDDKGEPDNTITVATPTDKEPVEQPATSKPVTVDPNKISKYKFELEYNSTERDIKKLEKKLKQYGIKMEIGALEFEKGEIQKFKGSLISVNPKGKALFNFKAYSFDKIFISFQHSPNNGPEQMRVWGK